MTLLANLLQLEHLFLLDRHRTHILLQHLKLLKHNLLSDVQVSLFPLISQLICTCFFLHSQQVFTRFGLYWLICLRFLSVYLTLLSLSDSCWFFDFLENRLNTLAVNICNERLALLANDYSADRSLRTCSLLDLFQQI